MPGGLDTSHDPARRSWVTSANTDDTDFPIQNLPLGVFTRRGGSEPAVGTAIGNMVLDLARARDAVSWDADAIAAFDLLRSGDLGALMAAGPAPRRKLRRALCDALSEGNAWADALAACLVPQREARMQVPCRIRGYTGFDTGIHHATTLGRLLRPDDPLPPNYKWVPIGCHGRASTIDVSGQSFPRPMGQVKGATDVPGFGPCRRLDYEFELGAFVGAPNEAGQRLSIDQAEDHLFGMVLLDDWSARDMQAWEDQPLGPFLSKSFATTISPWVVTMEALAPLRVPFVRAESDPRPLPYLDSAANRAAGSFDLELETWLLTSKMLADGHPAHRLARSNFRHAYWTLAQMLTHHTSNGCTMSAGDLLGTGAQSGPAPGEGGSLIELTLGGKQPITLPNGETRTFLRDGDTVILRAFGAIEGARRIGFGECRGKVLPAR